VVLLLAPVPARLKEWAYAGFAITLASALIAHFSIGEGPEAWGWAAGTSVLWGLSYYFWRRLNRRNLPKQVPPKRVELIVDERAMARTITPSDGRRRAELRNLRRPAQGPSGRAGSWKSEYVTVIYGG